MRVNFYYFWSIILRGLFKCIFGFRKFKFHFSGRTLLHVIAANIQFFINVNGFQFGFRANFRKSISHQSQAIDVIFEFVDDFLGLSVALVRAAKMLNPTHNCRNGRSQLVSRFLRHAHPNLVLFTPSSRAKSQISEADEEGNQSELKKRIIFQQR